MDTVWNDTAPQPARQRDYAVRGGDLRHDDLSSDSRHRGPGRRRLPHDGVQRLQPSGPALGRDPRARSRRRGGARLRRTRSGRPLVAPRPRGHGRRAPHREPHLRVHRPRARAVPARGGRRDVVRGDGDAPAAGRRRERRRPGAERDRGRLHRQLDLGGRPGRPGRAGPGACRSCPAGRRG